VLRKAVADLLENVYDRRVVIIARNPDNDVRRFDLFDALGEVRSKCSVIIEGMDRFFG